MSHTEESQNQRFFSRIVWAAVGGMREIMNKRILSVIMCFSMLVISGCGQQEELGNQEFVPGGEESAETEYPGNRADIIKPKAASRPEKPDMSEEAGIPEDGEYAIYQRFLNGDEPLYFREDTWFEGHIDCRTGTYTSYTFQDICGIINLVYNSNAPMEELVDHISYAYIDCGADGNEELALLFHDLYDRSLYSAGYVILVIKDVDGRLEMCYLIDPYYKEDWELTNRNGIVTYWCNAGTGLTRDELGYIDAEGVYNVVYSVMNDYSFFYVLGYADEFSDEIPEEEFIVLKTYYIFESYGQDKKYGEYNLLAPDSGDFEDSEIDFESISKAVADATGMAFYSYDEIQKMIADREVEIGLTEELKLKEELKWIPLGGEAAPEGFGAA